MVLPDDATGKTMKTKKVITAAIKHIREFTLETMKNRGIENLDEQVIKWVVTVPAIWSHKAKQFTREAALEVLISLLSLRNDTVLTSDFGFLEHIKFSRRLGCNKNTSNFPGEDIILL